MYFYLCFALILLLTTRIPLRMPVWLSLWAVIIVVFNILSYVLPLPKSPVLDVVTHPLTLEFIAGAGVGLAIKRNFSAFGRTALLGGIIWLVGGLLLFSQFFNTDWGVLLVGPAFTLIVYGAAANEKSGRTMAPRWLVALGNASYSTYLSHVLVMSALGRIYWRLPLHNRYAEVVFVAICITGANLFGLISQRLIEIPPLRWARRLLHRPQAVVVPDIVAAPAGTD